MGLFDDAFAVIDDLKEQALKNPVFVERSRDRDGPSVSHRVSYPDPWRMKRAHALLRHVVDALETSSWENRPSQTFRCKSDSGRSCMEKLDWLHSELTSAQKQLAEGWKTFKNADGTTTFELKEELCGPTFIGDLLGEHLRMNVSKINLCLDLPYVRRDKFDVLIPEPEKNFLDIYTGSKPRKSYFDREYLLAAAQCEDYFKGEMYIRLQDSPENRAFLEEKMGVDLSRMPVVDEKEAQKQKAKATAATESLKSDINHGVLLYRYPIDMGKIYFSLPPDRVLCFTSKGTAADTLRKLKEKRLLPEKIAVETLSCDDPPDRMLCINNPADRALLEQKWEHPQQRKPVYGFPITKLVASQVDAVRRVQLFMESGARQDQWLSGPRDAQKLLNLLDPPDMQR